MKRVILLFLGAAMALDVTQQAYNSDIADAIAQRGPNQSLFRVLANSPLMTTIEHWGMFFLGFGLLSLLMALRRPRGGPDIIG